MFSFVFLPLWTRRHEITTNIPAKYLAEQKKEVSKVNFYGITSQMSIVI